jgi:hypothetical protein
LIEGVEVEVEAEEVAEDVGVGKKIMRNRAHAEALLILYSVRKWREIRRAGRRYNALASPASPNAPITPLFARSHLIQCGQHPKRALCGGGRSSCCCC